MYGIEKLKKQLSHNLIMAKDPKTPGRKVKQIKKDIDLVKQTISSTAALSHLKILRIAPLERLAPLLVVHSFRNTILENYHAEWPQFTDVKMKVLMKQAVNKLYTALCALLSDNDEERAAVLEVLDRDYPHSWDAPELEPGFFDAVEFRMNVRRLEATGNIEALHAYEAAYWKEYEARKKQSG